MDSLLTILFCAFTFFSFNLVSSFASQPSYEEHCASTVADSTPTTKLTHNPFPLADHHNGFYKGGATIIDVGASWNRFSFRLSKRSTRETQTPNLFKLQGTLSFRSANTFSDGSYYMGQRGYRKGYVSFKLEGFWHEPSGKVCMVGISSGYSRKGDSLNVNAVFKLNDVFNVSNITTLVTGSLENLSSEKGDDSYFEPISVLMLPNEKYNYTLDSAEVVNEFSDGSDADQGLALNLDSLSFCKYPISSELGRLQLEYSRECHASKNCSISGSSDKLPSLMSLTTIGCSLTTKKHRLRVLVEFPDISYYVINQSFDPKTVLVGEGWWDEKNNMLCVVACHIMGKSSSLVGTHVGDCSVRLRLRFPSIWSIRNTSSIVGQIWSNKSGSDSGYFKMVTFRNDEGRGVGVPGLKYEFSRLETVNKSCPRPTHKPNEKTKRYPEAYSYSMRFDMSVKESMKRVGWGYSEPIAVDDEISEFSQYRSSGFISFSDEVPDETIDINNGSLFNMSYGISLSVLHPSKSVDKNYVFNFSSERVKIIAEGVYDAGAGTLCMVGCRELNPISKSETPVAHSADCDILLKIQFPPLDSSDRSYIKGSIESRRKESDSLYFKRLDVSAVPNYRETARRKIWRMDMEVVMALISKTLACVFVGLQLYKVKREPNVFPFISLIMMSILTLGHMVPLVLNFEALLTPNPNNRRLIFGNNPWLEVNEISVRLVTMVAFLLQFRLLYLTWSARKSGESKNSQWIAERNTGIVTLLLYAAGLLVAFMLKLKKNGDKDSVYIPMYNQPSPWENIKSYGGLVLDGFLLPQIILNLFLNTRVNVLSSSFYFGTTFVRLLPHAYDLYRTHTDDHLDNGSYYYADPSEDFYSTAWDIAIPLGGFFFAVIIYLQQRFGAHYILPQRFKRVYQKVPVVTDSEAEVETTNK
ncbi:uncharacterized protein LOC124834665 [Vigna umbellata]|uniref:uncharacterized protein LOC124834665 n=1 Tax=Vigna umbellata TaxID=87088 RepID=UPI001F5F3989|nr:uncharacterized protein LOC124834665 [Vigna umbellata]